MFEESLSMVRWISCSLARLSQPPSEEGRIDVTV